MAISFVKCEMCPCKFRIKTICKPYIGMYKDKPVFHWYYFCPRCLHVYTVQYYNEHLNKHYDRYWGLRYKLILNEKNLEQYERILNEIEVCQVELLDAIENMKRELIPIRKV